MPLAGGFAILALDVKDERRRNLLVEVVTCLTSVLVWMAILSGGREPFKVYSFTRGFDITFLPDGLAMVFAGLIALMWPVVDLYAFEYMEHADRKSGFFGFFTMTYGITLGVAFSGNLVTLYVFFEMLTLVTVPLVSHYQDHEGLYAGRQYALYTMGGAGLAFLAVVMATVNGQAGAFLYGGSLSPDVSRQLMLAVYLLGFFGFGVKAAIFPFHEWLPLAGVAPTPVTALLHAVAVVNSGVFAVTRLTWYVYGPDFLLGTWAQNVCLGFAAFTIVFAAVQALRQRHFKRRLAYSTVSNLSYMLFGVLLLTPSGLQAGLAHMVFLGVIKITLFMCAGSFMHVTGNKYIFELNGVGRKMPWTFGMYTIGAFSLSGIPLFAGFISKYRLIWSGIEAGHPAAYVGTVALIVGAFFCAMYTLTVSARAFFPIRGTARYEKESGGDAGWRILVSIGIFTVADILLGLMPGPIMDLLGRIAQGLM